jgi:hypothetical protein
VDGTRLLGLETLDQVDLALEGLALLLERVDLRFDRLQLALPLLGLRDLGVQLLELGRLPPPEGRAEHDGAHGEEPQQQEGLDAPRGRGGSSTPAAAACSLLLLGRAVRRQKVDANHLSPTFRTASPTAMAADGPISLMKSGSKSFGL